MKLCVVPEPLSDNDCTYGPEPVDEMVTLPPGRWIRIDGNDGPCRARVSAPGVAGYIPSADQTYHAEVAPRSSLPGSPPAPVVNDSFITRRTAALVPAGWAAEL